MYEMVKVDMLIGDYSPESPNCYPFRSTASRFRVTVNFSIGGRSCCGATTVNHGKTKVGNCESRYVDRYQVSTIPHAEGPIFCPFRFTGSRFRVTINFSCDDGTDGGATTVKPMF